MLWCRSIEEIQTADCHMVRMFVMCYSSNGVYTSQRKVHTVDRIVELTGLDHKCVRKAQARTLLQEESLQVRLEFPLLLFIYVHANFEFACCEIVMLWLLCLDLHV